MTVYKIASSMYPPKHAWDPKKGIEQSKNCCSEISRLVRSNISKREAAAIAHASLHLSFFLEIGLLV